LLVKCLNVFETLSKQPGGIDTDVYGVGVFTCNQAQTLIGKNSWVRSKAIVRRSLHHFVTQKKDCVLRESTEIFEPDVPRLRVGY
jgi:hypothetical protein